MDKEKQIEPSGMRAYEELSDIHLPVEQEEMMDIICNAWEECQQSDCKDCTDRPRKYMRVMACTALKYTRLLCETGYRKQIEGNWYWADDGYCRCSNCHQKAPITPQYQDEPTTEATAYCPHCGAKMKGV